MGKFGLAKTLLPGSKKEEDKPQPSTTPPAVDLSATEEVPDAEQPFDPLADLELRVKNRQERMDSFNETAAEFEAVQTAQDDVQEERRNWFADMGYGVNRGIAGAVEETMDLVATADEAMMAWATDIGVKVGISDTRYGYDPRPPTRKQLQEGTYGEPGWFTLSPEESDEYPQQSIVRLSEQFYAYLREAQPETQTAVGGMTETMTKFIVGFALAGKQLKAAGWVAKADAASLGIRGILMNSGRAATAGAMADAAVFDGHEGRLSDFLVEMDSPAFNNVVTQYLASNADDSELEGRMKNMIEGAALGALFDGFLIGIRMLRRAKTNWRIAKEAEKVKGEVPLPHMGAAQPDEVVHYHGTPEKFDNFDVSKANSSDPDDIVNGIWFTTSRTEAETAGRFPYGRPNAPDARVIEAHINLSKPATRADVTKAAKEAVEQQKNGAEGTVQELTRKILTGQGFDGFVRTSVRINAQQLRETGKTVLEDGRVLKKSDDGGIDLYDKDGGHITGYANIDDAVKQLDETVTVVFDTKAITTRTTLSDTAKKLGYSDQLAQDANKMRRADVVEAAEELGVSAKGSRETIAARIQKKVRELDDAASDARQAADEARQPKSAEARQPKSIEDAARETDPVEMLSQRRIKIADQVRGAVQLTRQQADDFMAAVRRGDDQTTEKILADFNETNIDWSKIETADDIKRVLLETEKMFADLTKEAKGGVQSNAQTKRLANLVDANGSEVDKLFADLRGGQGVAARFYAAQRIMMSSAAEVIRTAEIAKNFKGDTQQAADALRAIQMHAAIQAEVKGAQTEIARALQAMGMIKDSIAENFKHFDELRISFGKGGSGDKAWNAYMDDLLKSRSLNELNRNLDITGWQRAKNILIEYTVNAMLSSPKTHAINLTSNVLNTFLYSADRFLGGSWRYMVNGDKAALREARIDLVEKLTRMDEAFKLAKQAWKEGTPITDIRQKMEFGNRISIKMKGDSWLAKTVNGLGTVIRTPGRALIAGDEFFKAVTRNSEISVLAFRQADGEALAKGMQYGDEAYEAYVKKRMLRLSDADILTAENHRIRMAARDKSRLATFQENAISVGGDVGHALNKVPMFKLVIAPFYRTPANIIRQGAFDRTPLGFLFKEHRRTLREGHPRAVAEQVARHTTGVIGLTTFYQWCGVGDKEGDSAVQIVGKIPYDSSAKLAGVKDYSIRFGNHWFQFNRLEPMGMWLGAVADMKYMMEYSDDEENSFSYYQAAMGAFVNNITNKTWAKSFTDLIETIEGVANGRPTTVQRATAKFLAGEFGKLVPQMVKGAARGLEGDDQSFAKEAWSTLDIIGERSTLWGKQPDKHDLLGRMIPRDAGFSILMNPFTHIEHSDDPVDQEFFRLGFLLAPMQKTLGSGGIDLTVDEYSRMTGLVAETGIHRILTGLVTDPSWNKLTDPMKKVLLKNQVNQARQTARLMMLSDEDLVRRVTQHHIDAALLLVEGD